MKKVLAILGLGLGLFSSVVLADEQETKICYVGGNQEHRNDVIVAANITPGVAFSSFSKCKKVFKSDDVGNIYIGDNKITYNDSRITAIVRESLSTKDAKI